MGVYMALVSGGWFDRAVVVARHLGLSMRPVFETLAHRCVLLQQTRHPGPGPHHETHIPYVSRACKSPLSSTFFSIEGMGWIWIVRMLL